MKRYTAVVDQEGDSAFGMWFPDLPGCHAAADEIGDIIPKAIEAINLFLEGEDDLPASTNVPDIAKMPEVREAMQDGAWLQSMPYIGMPAKEKTRINVTIDDTTLRAIDAAAKERGLSRSAFITQAAIRDLESA